VSARVGEAAGAMAVRSVVGSAPFMVIVPFRDRGPWALKAVFEAVAETLGLKDVGLGEMLLFFVPDAEFLLSEAFIPVVGLELRVSVASVFEVVGFFMLPDPCILPGLVTSGFLVALGFPLLLDLDFLPITVLEFPLVLAFSDPKAKQVFQGRFTDFS
jgi:hypothetical protein